LLAKIGIDCRALDRQASRPFAGAASDDRLAAGAGGWAQATFLLHSRFEAMSAPARNVASLAHATISSVTHSQPTKVPKLQSTLLYARRTP
jgi:hypothetical protein